MTKKHYIPIARILFESPISQAEKLELAKRLAAQFADDNPLFDKQRFLSAAMEGTIQARRGTRKYAVPSQQTN